MAIMGRGSARPQHRASGLSVAWGGRQIFSSAISLFALFALVFNPKDVFERLYHGTCMRACKVTAFKDHTHGTQLPNALMDFIFSSLIAFI